MNPLNQFRCNVISVPNLGRNLTDADVMAFYEAGLALPEYAHGPRDCTADWYALEDRADRNRMLGHMVERIERGREQPRDHDNRLTMMERLAFAGLNLEEVEV